jgi:hypothetical protein
MSKEFKDVNFDLTDVSNMVNIRNYMASLVESATITSTQSHAIRVMVTNFDKLILSKLMTDSFKKALGMVPVEKTEPVAKSTLK